MSNEKRESAVPKSDSDPGCGDPRCGADYCRGSQPNVKNDSVLTLRDRIAAALLKSHCDRALDSSDWPWLNSPTMWARRWYPDAEAVIASLNLSVPVEYLSVDGGRRNFMLAGHYTVEVSDE